MTSSLLENLLRDMDDHRLIELLRMVKDEILRRDICEHGVQVGEWCAECNAEYKAALAENESESTP